jgi:D-glycero-alpha-D-manno-heptose-7-phosphate kinase
VILSRAPLRISLAGGGSDLPAFYEQASGSVLSFAIDKYVYIAAHELFKGGIRLSYSRTEEVETAAEIEHPLIRETFLETDFKFPVEIGSFADVPGTGTGLGSSSAFTVALLNSLLEIQGQNNYKNDKQEFLAASACRIEIERCGQQIGKQDQYASAYGGVNLINFYKDGTTHVESLLSDPGIEEFINSNLALFYLGFGRPASEILNEQSMNLRKQENTYNMISKIKELVPEMRAALQIRDCKSVGEILTRGWELKASTSESITSTEIERALTKAISHGAHGGKVVGAGGGGFILVAVEPDKREDLISNFVEFRHLPFKVSSKGSEIIYQD